MDFPITATELSKVFIGNYGDLMKIVKSVISLLHAENDKLVGQGKKGKSSFVTVVHDRERFIQEMVKRGVKLKPPK